MTDETIQDYYIASAECREVKSYNGSIMTADGTPVWLGYDEGYAACQREKESAHKFKTPEEIRGKAEQWDGMPWYFALKPGTLHIYHVKVRTTIERVETEV